MWLHSTWQIVYPMSVTYASDVARAMKHEVFAAALKF